MPAPDSEPGRSSNRQEWFATTYWSVVLAAGDGRSPEAAAALEKLCQSYWYPLYAFVRRSGHDEETAKDLTQSFFARFLGKNYLKDVDHTKGRFRSFLQCYLSGEKGLAPYAEVAGRLNLSVDAIKKTVERLRRRYGELLREEIAQTVAHPAEIDDEIRWLRAALA